MERQGVSDRYLSLRRQALEYTNEDMNLQLENDRQVYLAVFDIPTPSLIVGNQTKTLVLVFGLNVHLYYANGEAETGLEQKPAVMRAMQSLLISSPQVLDEMELTEDTEFYDCDKTRVYLKTGGGVYQKELDGQSKKSRFLNMLLTNVLEAL